MPETFLNKAQLTGLSADARRTEILRAKQVSEIGKTVEWTPTLRQGNNLSTPIPITSNSSCYSIVGDWVVGEFGFTVNGAGTAGATVRITLPVPPLAVVGNIGVGAIYDASGGQRYPAIMDMIGGPAMWFADSTQASSTWALGTVTFTAALAANDILGGSFRYRWR